MTTRTSSPARKERHHPALAAIGAAAALSWWAPAQAQTPLCDGQTFARYSCVECPPSNGVKWPDTGCVKAEFFSCVTGAPTGWGYGYMCQPATYVGSSTESQCLHRGATEICGDHLDNNFDGCADEGCTLGAGACSCVASCASPSCSSPPEATCDPRKGGGEICGNGEDDNCNGVVDEGCAVPSPTPTPSPAPRCKMGSTAGEDPILLANRSAVTEPFTDFAVEALQRLSLTRTYSSKDTSVLGGPVGPFGRGWHHDWEAELRCSAGICTITRGLAEGMQFSGATPAISLGGTETWNVYRAHAVRGVFTAPHGGLLVERPDGEWIVFQVDGSELHFRSVCDACAGQEASDVYCAPVSAGGRARLVASVDASGRTTRLAYDRAHGSLIEASDDLGHALRLASGDACGTRLASTLSYDGRVVATYSYLGWDLVEARDGDGRRLRGYAYDPLQGALLLAVLDEAGTAIAEFSYDLAGRAIGVVDRSSSVSVDYGTGAAVLVTEHYGSAASATSQRVLDIEGRVVSISDQCACGPATHFTYDDRRLSCVTDASGRQSYRQYDQLGRVISTAEYSGAACPPPPPYYTIPSPARQEWRDYGLVKPIAAGVGLDLDRPASISRKSTIATSNYAAESIDYDPAPNTTIDPAGYACAAGPLPFGSVVCRSIQTGYTTAPNGAGIRDRLATFYSYDARGRLAKTIGPLSLDRPSASDVLPVEERIYWGDAETPERRGRLRELRRYPSPTAAPLVTSFDYDAFGVSRTVAPDGGVTLVTHDGRGRPTFVTAPDGGRWETRYQDGTSPRLTLSPTGATRRYSYDSKGRVSSVDVLAGDPDLPGANPAVIWSERKTYDPSGNAVHVEYRDQGGAVTWTQDREFDVQHRVVREAHPENPALARTTTFDPTGLLSAMTDEQGRVTAFGYDGLRRVLSVRRSGADAQGAPVSLEVARYTYQTNADALASASDGKTYPQATTYRRDDFGRLETALSYTLGYANPGYAYDPRGNVLQRKLGQTTVDYAYDGLDRLTALTARNAWDGTSIAYTFRYDENGRAGRLTTVVEPERTVRLGYDAAGRLTSESFEESGVAVALVTTYRYDLDGDVTGITLPSGRVLTYALDPATKQPTRVDDSAGGVTYASAIGHYPFGALRALTFGNGLTLTRVLNRRYEPVSIVSGPVQLGYGLSPAGDVSSLAEGGTTRTFTYDFLDRLVESPGSFTYGYDGAGNRTSQTVDGASATYALYFDKLTDQRVPWGTSTAQKLVFGYDQQLSVSAIGAYDPPNINPQRAVCLRHDPLARLTSVGIVPPMYAGGVCQSEGVYTSVVARFKYDFRGRRVARFSGGQWTYFVNGPDGEPLEELAQTASPTAPWAPARAYAWVRGTPVAQVEYASSPPRVYAIHADHLGLPRALTSPRGAVVWSAATRPYGDLVETLTPDPETGATVVTNLRLPGQYDERLFGNVGLQGPYYNWNRWYLPGVGRYLELDPVALGGGLNGWWAPDWYNFAMGNPVRYTDRDSLFVPPPWYVPILPWVGRLPWLIPLFPTPMGGDPCESVPNGCAPKPQSKPPNDCSPIASKPCRCTCLGPVNPDWNPGDTHHGDRHVGEQPYPTACRDECTMRGFSNSQCI